MIRRAGIAGIIFGLLTAVALPVSVDAETLSVTKQITVTATVKPARYVILNQFGDIEQIVSNNDIKLLEPEVYKNNIAPNSRVAVTPELTGKVDQLLIGKEIKPGVLYDRKIEQTRLRSLAALKVMPVNASNTLELKVPNDAKPDGMLFFERQIGLRY